MNSDRFNEVYSQFITTVVKKFKLGEKELNKKVISNLENDNNHYVDLFIKNFLPYIDEISACNLDFFRYNKKSIYICEDLDIKEIFEKMNFGKGGNSRVLFHNICTYIMTLYLVLLKDESNIEKYVNANYCDYETYSQMISVINAKDEIVSNWKENNRPDEPKKVDNNKKEVKSNETSSINQTSSSTHHSTSSTSQPASSTSQNNASFPFGDIENTQIGKLAEELAEKIEGKGDIKMPEVTNPNDIFKMMFSGGDDNPIANIMSTVCNELDTKIKSGELDQKALFNEAQGLMGSSNMFNPAEMMKNMPKDMMKNMPGMPNIGGDEDSFSDDCDKEIKEQKQSQKKKVKIKRKKKVPKKPPSVKERIELEKKTLKINEIKKCAKDAIKEKKQNDMLEETLNEVINS